MPLKYDKSYYRPGVFLRGGAIPVDTIVGDDEVRMRRKPVAIAPPSLDPIAERIEAAKQRLEELRAALKRRAQ